MPYMVPIFLELTPQAGGYLSFDDPPCHGLFYYHTLAQSALQRAKENLVYEGEADVVIDLEGLFKGIARMYGVSPDEMGKHWPAVRLQVAVMGGEVIASKHQFFNTRLQ